MEKSWIYVALTSMSEWVWIYGFNKASTWWYWILIIAFILLDLHFLSKACESLPTGTVYAIFAGTGTLGTFLMDVFLFDKQIGAGKVLFIIMVLGGVVGLKLSDNYTSKGVAR